MPCWHGTWALDKPVYKIEAREPIVDSDRPYSQQEMKQFAGECVARDGAVQTPRAVLPGRPVRWSYRHNDQETRRLGS